MSDADVPDLLGLADMHLHLAICYSITRFPCSLSL